MTVKNWGEKIAVCCRNLLFILWFTKGPCFPATDIGVEKKRRGHAWRTLLISPIDRNKIGICKVFLLLPLPGNHDQLSLLLPVNGGWGLSPQSGYGDKFCSWFYGTNSAWLTLSRSFKWLVACVGLFLLRYCWVISFYAKSFKEAQSYMGPLVIFCYYSEYFGPCSRSRIEREDGLGVPLTM